MKAYPSQSGIGIVAVFIKRLCFVALVGSLFVFIPFPKHLRLVATGSEPRLGGVGSDLWLSRNKASQGHKRVRPGKREERRLQPGSIFLQP